MTEKILVIKLSALGDFVQAMAACKLIREYHYDAEITLLTTKPYVPLAKMSPYFDDIWDDGRPEGLSASWKLARRISKSKFRRIYDLQTSDRTNNYYRMLTPPRPEWSGVARGCSHFHKNTDRVQMHTVDRQAEQLAMAGVGLGRGRVGGRGDNPDLSWAAEVQKGAARTELTWFGVRKPFALLVPGSSPHRPEKRWSAKNFGNLAMKLRRAGIMPVILGTDSEKDDAYVIQQICPGALNLVNRTDHVQIIMLARQAALAIGNDTGPMHLIGSSNCPSVVLFSDASDPNRCAPRGEHVTTIQREELSDLTVNELLEILLKENILEPTLAPFKRASDSTSNA